MKLPPTGELKPLWSPTHLRVGRGTEWLLHLIDPLRPTQGVCGVSVDASSRRELPDYPQSYDVCLRCALRHIQYLTSVIIQLEGDRP